MNPRSSALLLLFLVVLLPRSPGAEDPPRLGIQRGESAIVLDWSAVRRELDGSISRPFFELQRSQDLQHWRPIGERQRSDSASPNRRLSTSIPSDTSNGAFRLVALEPTPAAKLAQGGAEVFGYGDAFEEALDRLGQISPAEFATRFPYPTDYLPKFSWDPTTAAYWESFNADPEVLNLGKGPEDPGYRHHDFRLNPSELSRYKANGFVVSERLGAASFAEVFYQLWHADLPVFISCDALLQAWHRTYDAILEEVETTHLFQSTEAMLAGMAGQLQAADQEVGQGVLRDSLRDADYFLAVARSLLAGAGQTHVIDETGQTAVIPPTPSMLGQDSRVAQTLADIREEKLLQVQDFMGFCRVVDYSQFKVRGHYTHTERLGRYFQCLMWLGRIDIPLAGGPWKRCPDEERMASPRELGLAVTLWRLLTAAGQFETWADMERTLTVFVGTSDSLNFAQLSGLLAGAGIRSLADVRDLATLERLQRDLQNGDLGVQNIRSDWFLQPLGGAARYGLPRTFCVFGQKFVPDSWALSQTVFSSILWVENGETNKVDRRVPGALDVAFSVLANDQVVPELLDQLRGTYADPGRPHALGFRDGYPYQHNLAAVRQVMDAHSPEVWDSNLYWSWLGCLRALSAPTTTDGFPEVMRSRAWAMKTLNTQLASWTQLRHDTILYAKQSYTDSEQCLYPAGYVEPRVEFWQRLGALASLAADQIGQLRYAGTYDVLTNVPAIFDGTGAILRTGGDQLLPVPISEIQARQVQHLRSFAERVRRLEQLAAKELAGECFSSDDGAFLDSLMEERGGGGCGGPFTYSGWYPQLFYRTIDWFGARTTELFHWNYGAGAADALVADVHTDVPSVQDPGSVLHEAVGRVNFMLVAVESGGDRFVCAGPVLSHYEFEVVGPPRRLSDEEWGGGSRGILGDQYPADLQRENVEGVVPPPWTSSYLAR